MPGPSNPAGVHIGIHIVVDSAEIGESARPKLSPTGELSIIVAESAILVAKNAEGYHALRRQLAAFIEAGDKVFHQRDAFDEVEAKERSNWARHGNITDPKKVRAADVRHANRKGISLEMQEARDGLAPTRNR